MATLDDSAMGVASAEGHADSQAPVSASLGEAVAKLPAEACRTGEGWTTTPVLVPVDGQNTHQTHQIAAFFGPANPNPPANQDPGLVISETDGPEIAPLKAAPKTLKTHSGSMFRPAALKDGNAYKAPASITKRSRLQPDGPWPVFNPSSEASKLAKQRRVDCPGYYPNFLGRNACGAYTGMPFHSSERAGVKPNAAAPFVQPVWPDPEMLHRLNEVGSLAKPKQDGLSGQSEDVAALKKTVKELTNTVQLLTKKVESLTGQPLDSQKSSTEGSENGPTGK